MSIATFTMGEDYWENFKPASEKIDAPVLFFYGTWDWMAGPLQYRGVKFPQMLLWESQVGHIALLEGKSDVEKAILTYLEKFQF